MYKSTQSDPERRYRLLQERRQFFRLARAGLGGAALAALSGGVSGQAFAQATNGQSGGTQVFGGLPGLPHFAAKAKRVIYLFMSGAPSQFETFDYKPKLRDMFDKDLPPSIISGQRLTTMTSGQDRLPIAPSVFDFKQAGQSGTWVSELLPHTAGIVDDIAIVRSMFTEAINHDPAITFMQTGNQIPGRPSLGSWATYGLGCETENLPAFVVLNSSWTGRQEAQALFSRLWGASPLPSKHQGVLLRSSGDPVLYLSNPAGMPRPLRRKMLDTLAQLNDIHFQEYGDPEIQARIDQYEMAFRMQASVPELTDMGAEPKSTFDLYGPDSKKPGTFAANCLMARRLCERGVRFVQIYHRGWDQHDNLPKDIKNQCHDVDQGCAGLIKDLKQRGMLDDTLVIWGGEFGRTVYCQGTLTKENYGRDHHPRCFSMWMAGGGIKGGIQYGETDDFAYNIVDESKKVQIRDLNATILHLLGIDHERLSIKHQGLDLKLTGVEPARVVKELLA